MRVIGGSARGRRLLAPKGMDTRPTSDRVKEALFGILTAMAGPLDGCVALDLFAGTGGLGIEALSRGAERAVFVDSGREAAAVIAGNLESTRFREQGRVIRSDFRSALTVLESEKAEFGLIFIDPPYRKGLMEACLLRLAESPIVAEGAIIVAEHSSREETLPQYGTLRRFEVRVYGDTALSFFIKTEKGSP